MLREEYDKRMIDTYDDGSQRLHGEGRARRQLGVLTLHRTLVDARYTTGE